MNFFVIAFTFMKVISNILLVYCLIGCLVAAYVSYENYLPKWLDSTLSIFGPVVFTIYELFMFVSLEPAGFRERMEFVDDHPLKYYPLIMVGIFMLSVIATANSYWSGTRDSNPEPLGPKPSALAN
jgi:hypothetical protein